MKQSLATIVLLLAAIHAAGATDSTGTVKLDFSWQNHYATPVFNLPMFSNVHGQSYSVSVLRYYIGNVHLHRDDGYIHILPGYHLIVHDEEDESVPTNESINIAGTPCGSYTALSFTLGVDSADNIAGPQEGQLDPLRGMYWTWATGYIFFKLEGVSPASPQPKSLIEYHIGGFTAPYNNIQRITLPLRRLLAVSSTLQQSLEVSFDVGTFIDAQGGIDFRTTSSVTDAMRASAIAPRLQGAFHVR